MTIPSENKNSEGISVSKNNTARYKENVRIEVLYVLIGGNLSEERFSPEPPSKDF